MGHAVDNMYIVSHKSIVIEYCRYYDKGQKYKYLDSSRLLYAKRTCKRLDPLYCTSMKQSVQCWAFDPMLSWRCEWVWRRVLKTDRRDRRFSRLYLMEWTLFGFDPGTVPIFIALYQSTISLPPKRVFNRRRLLFAPLCTGWILCTGIHTHIYVNGSSY